MNAPGKGLLKVVSILFIVFGAIALVFSIIALLGAAALAAFDSELGGMLVVGTVIALIASALELVIGIIGVKKSGEPSQAGFFIVTGIILCVLQLVSMILNFQVTSLIGFVLPVLYIVGGAMNKKAA